MVRETREGFPSEEKSVLIHIISPSGLIHAVSHDHMMSQGPGNRGKNSKHGTDTTFYNLLMAAEKYFKYLSFGKPLAESKFLKGLCGIQQQTSSIRKWNHDWIIRISFYTWKGSTQSPRKRVLLWTRVLNGTILEATNS